MWKVIISGARMLLSALTLRLEIFIKNGEKGIKLMIYKRNPEFELVCYRAGTLISCYIYGAKL